MSIEINRMNDALAKFVLGKESRKDIALNLINSIFERKSLPQLSNLIYRDREQSPEFYKGKTGLLDLLCSDSNGTTVNVELQVENLSEMRDRILFYWSKIFTQLAEGDNYYNLARTACISIVDYVQFPEAPETMYYSKFSILNEDIPKIMLSEKFEIHFLEIKKWEKLPNRFENMGRMEQWLAYFSKKTPKNVLQDIAMQNPMINQALQAEHQFMNNPKLVTLYDQEEKARMDAEARERYVRLEGEKQGREQGEDLGIKKVAKNLLKMNNPIEMVMEATGLSEKTIRELM